MGAGGLARISDDADRVPFPEALTWFDLIVTAHVGVQAVIAGIVLDDDGVSISPFVLTGIDDDTGRSARNRGPLGCAKIGPRMKLRLIGLWVDTPTVTRTCPFAAVTEFIWIAQSSLLLFDSSNCGNLISCTTCR